MDYLYGRTETPRKIMFDEFGNEYINNNNLEHSDKTYQLLNHFNDLNETGKSEAIKRIGELTLVESYQSEECKIKIEHMKEAKRAKKLFNIDI